MDEPNISADSFRPLVESFFTRMTAEQWSLLKSGKPDDATKVQLAELLLNIISTISTALVKSRGRSRTPVSMESARSNLCDSLAQSFAPGISTKSEDLDQFTDMVSKEVMTSVQSSLSCAPPVGASSEEPDPCCFTEPKKLHKMICCVCRVLKTFSAKIKRLFKPQPPRQRRQATPPRTRDTEDQLNRRITTSSDFDMSSFTSEESTTSDVSSEDNVDGQNGKIYEKIINKEVNGVIEPLMDELSNPDYNMLQSQASVEIKAIAKKIAPLILNEHINIFSSPKSGGVGKMMENLFAKTFATATILKMLREVQSKFHREDFGFPDDKKEMKTLMADVDSLLDGSGDHCMLQTFKRLSRADMLDFTEEFADLFYQHATAARKPDAVMTLSVPESDRNMYADIKRLAMYFLSLMSWWMNNQVACYRDRVTLALMGNESSAAPEASKGNVMDSTKEQAEQQKMIVKVLVDQVVTKIHQMAKVACTPTTALALHLFENTWAKVQDIDLDIPPKIFRNLDKAVWEDLCKRWACPVLLLVALRLGEPEVGKCIASSIRSRLSKKPSAIYRFFSVRRKASEETWLMPFRLSWILCCFQSCREVGNVKSECLAVELHDLAQFIALMGFA
ncbi:uncharacterized protein LOC118318708 isoform X2 [Scophthalmus maximus]|uniref:uncharacterized protein LOC118318708 isoform X2 n=1 Tax=Scophthalmus maximus TaxID=52904 RepID=UPI0015E0E7A1|nr:uncharacterized protein LOC118318708 isoform X2 [Scophthalmus maximus]